MSLPQQLEARVALARTFQKRISERVHRRIDYSGADFENDITALLNIVFPFSVLPGVRLFDAEPRGRIAYGYEIDNLLHFRSVGVDYVVLIDAKRQSVKVDGSRWRVTYETGSKCAREQMDSHLRTTWEYLRPISGNTELKFIAIVASSDETTPNQEVDGFHNAEVRLCHFSQLVDLLVERFQMLESPGLHAEVLRISQSRFLELLRLSLPVPQLGHPEISNAMRYIDRCRRTLDQSLFLHFDPKPGRWVINGSAGMGKSVLLAYTAAVFSSGFELYRSLGDVGLMKAQERLAAIGYDSDPTRSGIAIVAMSMKQLESLREWFSQFVEQFQEADLEGQVRFRPPEFILCRPGEPVLPTGKRWSAILVDEAHDLPAFAAQQIVEAYNKDSPYLVVACDRHQKLQLAGSDARVLEGVDFTNRSTRLRHIYRNPAPVYMASLALMFRWLAEEGPKVLPTLEQMRDYFGFSDVRRLAAEGMVATFRSDAHPGNSWCHTVARFPDVSAVYTLLEQQQLQQNEVLWVRFSEEDAEFDYERIANRWTYHNCRTGDAQKISDKYIKGQDYPVVVIEGFPGFMDRWEEDGVASPAAETRMWAFRRELYLCASRATGFLYFVCNVAQTPEVSRIQSEVDAIIAAVATPEDLDTTATRTWKMTIHSTKALRRLDVFIDTEAQGIMSATAEAVQPPEPEPAPVTISEPARDIEPVAPAKPESADTSPPEKPQQYHSFRELASAQGASERRSTQDRRGHRSKIRKPKVPGHLMNARIIRLPKDAMVRDLAALLGQKPFRLISEAMDYNVFLSSNDPVPPGLAALLCERRGFRFEIKQ